MFTTKDKQFICGLIEIIMRSDEREVDKEDNERVSKEFKKLIAETDDNRLTGDHLQPLPPRNPMNPDRP